MTVRARMVDPRDVTVEILSPTYRVYFCDENRACPEFELDEASVEEAVEWAERERADHETFTLHVVVSVDHEVALVRLLGQEPPESDEVR